jgi:hypothetical protein
MGSDAATLQKSAETMSSDAATMMPERSTVSESLKTAATVSPTESEIATVAYLLWQDNGCPVGDWRLAKAMLKNALDAERKISVGTSSGRHQRYSRRVGNAGRTPSGGTLGDAGK